MTKLDVSFSKYNNGMMSCKVMLVNKKPIALIIHDDERGSIGLHFTEEQSANLLKGIEIVLKIAQGIEVLIDGSELGFAND